MTKTNKPTSIFSLAILFGVISLLFVRCSEQPETTMTEQQTSDETIVYDSSLAQKVGADDYGMKPYVIAFLKAGPNRDRDSLEATKLQRAHLDNIFRLADEGKLVVAGPFMDTGAIRGMYIFDVPTLEEAQALTATDPAIQAGSLVMELHQWYGSAAMPLLYDLHKKVSKKRI